MAAPVAESEAGTDRRTRRETLARWAPWGPGAKRAAVEAHGGPRLRLGYLLRHAAGVDAVDEDGTPLGTVESVADDGFWPRELVVRAGDGTRLRIPSARVVRAHPREARLVIGPAPEARREPWTSGSRRPPRKPAPDAA